MAAARAASAAAAGSVTASGPVPIAAVLAAFPGPLFIHIMVPALFLICSVGIVALYADDIRVSRLRRHGVEPPDDPDLGRPSH